MIHLSYLEGMREAVETIDEHGVLTLRGKLKTLELELKNPPRNASRNPLRAAQGLPLLDIRGLRQKTSKGGNTR